MISYSLIHTGTCVYQGVKNVSFLEILHTYVTTKWINPQFTKRHASVAIELASQCYLNFPSSFSATLHQTVVMLRRKILSVLKPAWLNIGRIRRMLMWRNMLTKKSRKGQRPSIKLKINYNLIQIFTCPKTGEVHLLMYHCYYFIYNSQVS